VINAFAAEYGLPLTGGNEAYLRAVLKDFNEVHKTNARYGRESNGHWIGFDETKDGKLLDEIRVKNGL
jgi:hypothetical protein